MGLVSSVGARVGVCAAIVVGLGLDAAVAAGWVGAAVALGAVVGLAGSDGPGAPSEHAASVTAAAASAAVNMATVWRAFIGVDVLTSVALYHKTLSRRAGVASVVFRVGGVMLPRRCRGTRCQRLLASGIMLG